MSAHALGGLFGWQSSHDAEDAGGANGLLLLTYSSTCSRGPRLEEVCTLVLTCADKGDCSFSSDFHIAQERNDGRLSPDRFGAAFWRPGVILLVIVCIFGRI